MLDRVVVLARRVLVEHVLVRLKDYLTVDNLGVDDRLTVDHDRLVFDLMRVRQHLQI